VDNSALETHYGIYCSLCTGKRIPSIHPNTIIIFLLNYADRVNFSYSQS